MMDGDEYAAVVCRRLNVNDADERRKALEILGRLGDDAAPHVAAIAVRLGDSDASVRWSAAVALSRLLPASAKPARTFAPSSPRAVATEVAAGIAARHHTAAVRRAAVAALQEIAPDCTVGAVCADLVADACPDVRRAACEAVGVLGERGAPHVEEIAACLRDPSWDVRRAAATSLGRLVPGLSDGERIGRAIRGMTTALGVENSVDVQRACAHSLGEVGRCAGLWGPPETPEVLARCSRSDDGALRRLAVWALGRLGAPAVPYARAIAERLGDGQWSVRRAACNALAGLSGAALPGPGSDAGIVSTLVQVMVSDEIGAVRWAAVTALEKLGPSAAPHARTIAERASRDECTDVRRAAVWALGGLSRGDLSRESPLAARVGKLTASCLCRDVDATVRQACAIVQGGLGQAADAGALSLALTDRDTCVRIAAAEALSRLGGPVAARALATRPEVDSDAARASPCT